RDLLAEVVSQRDGRLPEVAVSGAGIDRVAPASEQTRPPSEILSDPQRQEEPSLLIGRMACCWKDRAREDGGRQAALLVMEEAIFDAELQVARAVLPTLDGCMRKAERERCSQLDTVYGAIVEVESHIRVEHGVTPLASGKTVDFPMPGVRRHRIVREVRWAGECWRRRPGQGQGDQSTAQFHAASSVFPGCLPGRCRKIMIRATITTARTADAMGRLIASPPLSTGLSRKSPTVAPSGRVRMKAAQNRTMRLTFVVKKRIASTAKPAPNTSAPPE